MEFEFDERKSESNRGKHGIDFIQAQALWEDPDRLEVPARIEEEKRFILIGKIN
ncbi:MAG: BrnT family toxin [Spirochaetales bacterium]|nr:BrnT family toxin [Spirochaetales bacterium]